MFNTEDELKSINVSMPDIKKEVHNILRCNVSNSVCVRTLKCDTATTNQGLLYILHTSITQEKEETVSEYSFTYDENNNNK